MIDFEFVPTKDTMKFRFVFGSSEWNSFPCSQYNDVFGFFVSGPGINGTFNAPVGYPNGAKNYALVPTTNIPITISSITHATQLGSCTTPSYPQYYVANNQATTGIGNINAYTTVMEVIFPVQKCQTYHFAIAIGDGSDATLHSYVFLEANSFSPVGIDIVPVPDYTNIGNDSVLYEGCGGVKVHFNRNDSVHLADTVIIDISGNAINGTDYSFVSDSIFFAPGQDTSTIYFSVPNDNIIEGNETLYISITDSTIDFGCSSTSDTLMLVIHDPIPLTANPTIDTFNCTQAPFNLDANPLTGLPNYTFLWSTGDTSQTTNVTSVNQTTDFYVTITDACSVFTIVDTATIVIQNPPTAINCPGDTIDCESTGANVYVQVTDPMPGLNYSWSTSQTTSAFFQTNPFTTTDYIVTVTQQCAGYHLVDTFTLTVDNPPFTLTTKDDTIKCSDPGPTIASQVSYTTPNFSFKWSNLSTDSAQTVTPNTTTKYYITVTDACNVNSVVDSVTVYVINPPIIVNTQNTFIKCIGDSVKIEASASGGNPPFTYRWSTSATDSFDYVSPTKDSTFYVSVTDLCSGDTVTKPVIVFMTQYPPLKIKKMDTIKLNCPGDVYSFSNLTIQGGSGNNEASWNNWTNTVKSITGVANQTTNLVVKARDKCNKDSTEASLTIYVPVHPPITSTISNDTAVCQQDLVQLVANAQGGNGKYKYQWNTGVKDSTYNAKSNNTTTYYVTITDECGNTSTNEVTVKVTQPKAEYEFEFIDDGKVAFKNKSTGATKYLWKFGDKNISTTKSPTHTYLSPKEYIATLIVRDSTGCIDSISYKLFPPLNIFIPNAFSPNGDNLNDIFQIYGTGIKDVDQALLKFNIVIYDRWGNKVFESNRSDFKWDGVYNGTKLPIGTYVYKLFVEGFNRNKYEDIGTITIVAN